MQPDLVFNVWCAVKPVVADALVRAMRAEALPLSVRIADLLPDDVDLRSVGDVRVDDVLAHRAALPKIALMEAELWGRDRERLTRERFASWDPGDRGDRSDYTEYSGWYLIERVLEDRFGGAAIAHSEGLRVGRPAGAGPASGLGCYYAPSDGPFLPLPHDLLPAFRCARSLAMGGHASARGLARWYSSFLVDGGGTAGDARTVPVPPAPGERWYSRVLLREVCFGRGFQLSIGQFLDVLELSERAFGHVGWNGASVGLVDPVLGVAIGLVLNTTDVGHDRFFAVRARIIRQLIEGALSEPSGR
jgi:CubicO group peptidase (beta-lactamase class C family)